MVASHLVYVNVSYVVCFTKEKRSTKVWRENERKKGSKPVEFLGN